MGVLSDFFIATEGVAIKIKDTERIPNDNKFEARNLSSFELTLLYQIALGLPPNDDAKLTFDEINTIEYGAIFVEKIPDRLRNLLANAKANTLKEWSVMWSDLEQLQWPHTDAHDVLLGLQQLSSKAVAKNLSVYLWVCA